MDAETTKMEQLRSLMFYLLEAWQETLHPDQVTKEQSRPCYTLLLIAEGSCSLYVDEQLLPALQQSCYLLAPGQNWYMSNYSDAYVRLYQVTFKAIDAKQEAAYTRPLRSFHYIWHLFPYSRGLKLLKQLAAIDVQQQQQVLTGDDMAWFVRQQLFLELVGMLLEHHLPQDNQAGALQAAEQSIHEMEQHYMEPLSIKQLAQHAGLPVAQYVSMIKQLTGMTPLDYLNQVRIKQAKTLLLTTEEPLRSIAHQVGFTDEYYFNRRFRQIAGTTPRQYVKLMKGGSTVQDDAGHVVLIPHQPRRIVYYGEALGDLWELGIRPIASNLYQMEHAWLAEEGDGIAGIADIGIPFHVGKARQLEPDLIVLSNMDERIYTDVSRIAPTIVYNCYAPLEERLRRLAQWLNRQHAAEQVIRTYRAKLQQTKDLLTPYVQSQETASVFTCHRGSKLFVMGCIGLSGLLHQLGVPLASRVKEMIANEEAYRNIDEHVMGSYAGERIFLVMPGNATSRVMTEKLLDSEQWNTLPAVREGRVHVVDEQKWNMLDAFSHLRQLEQLPALLQQDRA